LNIVTLTYDCYTSGNGQKHECVCVCDRSALNPCFLWVSRGRECWCSQDELYALFRNGWPEISSSSISPYFLCSL